MNSRVSSDEVEMFDTSSRILAYSKRNGKIEIYYNDDYVQQLRAKLAEVIRFFALFCAMEEIFIDITRLKAEFESEKTKTHQYLDSNLNEVDKRIDEIKGDIAQAYRRQEAIEQEKSRTQNTMVVESYNIEQRKTSIMGMTSEYKAHEFMESTRISEMKEAVEVAEINEILNVYPENINLLKEQKQFIEGGIQNAENFNNQWKDIEQYYLNTLSLNNPFETEYIFNHEELASITSGLVPCLEQLHKTSLILFNLEQEVTIRDKLVFINEQIGRKKIEIAGQIAARPYIQAILENCNKKVKESKARFTTYVVNDRVEHLSNCVDEINTNIDLIDTEMNTLRADFDVKSAKVSISRDHQSKKHTDPRAYSKSKEAYEAENEMQDYHKEQIRYQEESKRLEIYLKELEILENNKKSFSLEKVNNYENKNQMFISIADSYRGLLAIGFEGKHLIYDPSMINCLLSVLIKYICIAKKPGCCSFKSVPEYLAIDITATELIKKFAKILGSAKKIKIGCCSGNYLHKVYNCINIDVYDIINLLLDVRVLGSLRDENGNQQKISSKRRTELINQTLFFCIKELVHVKILQHQYLYQINMERAVEGIKMYEKSLFETLRHLNYADIAHKAEHHRLIRK
ncbi:hypothetical protein SteCoe_15408 [Stentor coeruleus]|uniref:Uncharacterized protein n=1 Tax=Stentor coeruleus TaxID=5963 RepID=A0A1R2C3R8_9CILI|nr:hypothetical protein SteCoe_15408 [Stentor coeruleus]